MKREYPLNLFYCRNSAAFDWNSTKEDLSASMKGKEEEGIKIGTVAHLEKRSVFGGKVVELRDRVENLLGL